jgi:hypothetical protein
MKSSSNGLQRCYDKRYLEKQLSTNNEEYKRRRKEINTKAYQAKKARMSNRQKNAERRANRKNMRESRKLKRELAEEMQVAREQIKEEHVDEENVWCDEGHCEVVACCEGDDDMQNKNVMVPLTVNVTPSMRQICDSSSHLFHGYNQGP